VGFFRGMEIRMAWTSVIFMTFLLCFMDQNSLGVR